MAGDKKRERNNQWMNGSQKDEIIFWKRNTISLIVFKANYDNVFSYNEKVLEEKTDN